MTPGQERTARCIAERFFAGDSLAHLADDYRLEPSVLEVQLRLGARSLLADLRANCANPCGECANCERACVS